MTINSEVQQGSWTGLARFNQFKYSHFFSMDNGESEAVIFGRINGDADLEILKTPVTVPEIEVPFVGFIIPKREIINLWEESGLAKLLETTKQTLDMEAKLTGVKSLTA